MPKSMREINTNLAIATYQNLETAMQSVSNVIEKVKDSKLKKELKSQYKEYDALIEKCEELAKGMDIELKQNGFFQKAKMWLSVNMATMLDKSNRKIASINIVGSTMGVIDLMGVISDSKKAKKELLDFSKHVLKYEEENIEKLKPYILVENNKPNSEITNDAKESGALEIGERDQAKKEENEKPKMSQQSKSSSTKQNKKSNDDNKEEKDVSPSK